MGISNIDAAMKVAKQMYDLESQNATNAGVERGSWADLDDREKNLRANAIDMLVRTDFISYTRRTVMMPVDNPG